MTRCGDGSRDKNQDPDENTFVYKYTIYSHTRRGKKILCTRPSEHRNAPRDLARPGMAVQDVQRTLRAFMLSYTSLGSINSEFLLDLFIFLPRARGLSDRRSRARDQISNRPRNRPSSAVSGEPVAI